VSGGLGVKDPTPDYLVGDQVLIELALRLRGHLRTTDVLARWGGEEFVVLLPHNNVEAAARLAEKLRQATLARPFPGAGTLTLSLGVAGYQPDETLDSWFTRADNALYAAKAAGRDRVVIAD
jgi:diguanylate cyclase (GGDEF)-like protein